jgi:glycosyltransferase involved in cell wall biosynthesis
MVSDELPRHVDHRADRLAASRCAALGAGWVRGSGDFSCGVPPRRPRGDLVVATAERPLIATERGVPMDGVLVAVPAHNEERFIGSVVHGVRLEGYTCLVIDDGSTDRTADIASAAGAIVARHITNKGKAAALNTALIEARQSGVSALVMMDGDSQHDPQEIGALLAPIRAGEADIVLGSRFIDAAGRIPRLRRFGLQWLTVASNVASGTRVSDSQSGFRALSRPAVEAFHLRGRGFSAEVEMQFLEHVHGLRHAEVPIKARYADPPKRNPFSQGAQVLDGLIGLTARFRPLLFFGLPSLVLLVGGLVLGLRVVDDYVNHAVFSAGYALLTVLLTVLGSIGLFAALVLHVLRGIFLDLEDQLQALTRGRNGNGSQL